MDNNKSKILTIIAGVISLIGVFFMVRIIMVGDDAIESDVANQGIISGFVYFAVALLIVVTLVTLVLSIGNLVKNPQNLKKTLIGLGILVALLAITHFTASDALATDAFGEAVEIKNTSGDILVGDEAKSITKWVAGLITFTGLLGAAGLGVIGFGIIKNLAK
jgi:uncharacterized membrane protein